MGVSDLIDMMAHRSGGSGDEWSGEDRSKINKREHLRQKKKSWIVGPGKVEKVARTAHLGRAR